MTNKFLKKDGTPYKNQGTHPFEQQVVYAVWMANKKNKIRKFSLLSKDGSIPNGIYIIKSWNRPRAGEKIWVIANCESDNKDYNFCWDIENIVVSTNKQPIEEIKKEEEIYEAEFIDNNINKTSDIEDRIKAAEIVRKLLAEKILENLKFNNKF